MFYITKYFKVPYPILFNYIKILKFFFVCMDLGRHMYLLVLTEPRQGCLQELELQAGMRHLIWVLEIEFTSSVRVANTLSSRQSFFVEPWLSWN